MLKAKSSKLPEVYAPHNEKMGVKELARLFAQENGVSRKEAETVVHGTFDTLFNALAKGNTIAAVGYFTIEIVERSERQGHNPATGAPMTIKACKNLKFKASKNLKEAVQ